MPVPHPTPAGAASPSPRFLAIDPRVGAGEQARMRIRASMPTAVCPPGKPAKASDQRAGAELRPNAMRGNDPIDTRVDRVIELLRQLDLDVDAGLQARDLARVGLAASQHRTAQDLDLAALGTADAPRDQLGRAPAVDDERLSCRRLWEYLR